MYTSIAEASFISSKKVYDASSKKVRADRHNGKDFVGQVIFGDRVVRQLDIDLILNIFCHDVKN